MRKIYVFEIFSKAKEVIEVTASSIDEAFEILINNKTVIDNFIPEIVLSDPTIEEEIGYE